MGLLGLLKLRLILQLLWRLRLGLSNRQWASRGQRGTTWAHQGRRTTRHRVVAGRVGVRERHRRQQGRPRGRLRHAGTASNRQPNTWWWQELRLRKRRESLTCDHQVALVEP